MKKQVLSNVMTAAWQFVKNNGYTMSEALKCAWRNIKLQAAMRTRIVKFHFQKIDGSIREAFGTLAERIVPATNGTSGRKVNNSVQTYFDTEKHEWRCFKKANLIDVVF